MLVAPICRPEAAALKGLTFVQALNAPAPFTWILTAEEGMVTVFPAVTGFKAAVALVKYAHTAMLFLPGFSDQEVTTVEVPLPLLAAVFGARVKLMLVPEVIATVSDSFSVALRATVAMLELAGAAVALPAAIKTAMAIAEKKAKLCKCAFMVLSLPGTAKLRIRLGRPILGQKSKFGTQGQYSQRPVVRRDYQRHLESLMSLPSHPLNAKTFTAENAES